MDVTLYSQKIRNMSFVCTMLVVAIHVHFSPVVGDSGWWFGNVFALGVSSLAVPCFFLLSGVLAAAHFEDEAYWGAAVAKRIRTLVVPYALWSIMFVGELLVMRCVQAMLHGVASSPSQIFAGHGLLEVLGVDVYRMPVLFPLWYIRSLFVLILVLPVFKWAADSKMRFFCLEIALVAMLLVSRGLPGDLNALFRFTISIEGAVYFLAGVMLARHGLPQLSVVWGVALGGVGLGWHLVRVCCMYKGVAVDPRWDMVAVPLMITGVWTVMPGSRWPRWLTSSAFGCYLIHPFFLLVFNVLLVWFGRWCGCQIIDRLVTSLCVWSACCICSVLSVIVLNVYLPIAAQWLFGGRVYNVRGGTT